MMIFLSIWLALGLVGYVLYMLNPVTRPKKIWLWPFPLATHLFFGPIGLLYGYICLTGLKQEVSKNESYPPPNAKIHIQLKNDEEYDDNGWDVCDYQNETKSNFYTTRYYIK